jgi:hypothetical protein
MQGWAMRLYNAHGSRIPSLHPNSWAADSVDGTVLQKSEASMFLCGAWAI